MSAFQVKIAAVGCAKISNRIATTVESAVTSAPPEITVVVGHVENPNKEPRMSATSKTTTAMAKLTKTAIGQVALQGPSSKASSPLSQDC